MFNQPPAPSGSVIAPNPTQPFGPAAPGSGPQGSSVPVSSQHFISPEPEEKKNAGIITTLFLIVAVIVAIVFIYLYISKYVEWDNIRTDIDGQVDAAVATAVAENTTKMEAEFAEREKFPYRDFMGPADYGSLSFKYPQTWSVYIEQDARYGGDFIAYLNPVQINPLSDSSINALRVIIRASLFDYVITPYNDSANGGALTYENRTIGGILANLYRGNLPDSGFQGAAAIFKLRDKTVILQTDAELFIDQFYAILDSVTVIP